MPEPPADVSSLTNRQLQIYDFIVGCKLGRGYPPTFREICTEFGIRSPNGVQCHLKSLERKGFIRRDDNRSRGITVLGPLPKDATDAAPACCPNCGHSLAAGPAAAPQEAPAEPNP